MSMSKFAEEYKKQLQVAVDNYPDEYPWAKGYTVYGNGGSVVKPAQTVNEVAAKMLIAVQDNTFNHDGRAMKATCKALGIKHTRKAILEYVRS